MVDPQHDLRKYINWLFDRFHFLSLALDLTFCLVSIVLERTVCTFFVLFLVSVVRSYKGSPFLLVSVKGTRTTVLRRLALRPEPFFEASDFEIRASVLRRLTVRSEPG